MKSVLNTIFAITFSGVVYGSDEGAPPKQWWSAPLSIEEIEKQDEAWAQKQIEKIENFTHDCEELEMKSSQEKRIKSTPCNSSKSNKNYLLRGIESMRLSNAKGWLKLKSLYQAGDEVRSYAAPPLSGSIGYILIREGVVIYTYETAQQ
ncbi:hypothetical protein FLL45_08780 [Aliikangiella marina]|uniref:Uncharacterized protein n=1 Tax=Aliikangiella marina TaxID=1712262 RepID=A0A545TCX2_9GAMM|nr:DUF2090 domain-containing protein [Aliikangiella marina]TQV75026.1 hypothetical protein FLL45_08780 [Aliikangiella marina]